MKNGMITDNSGNKRWYKDDLLHREDGPACEFTSGSKQWYFKGLLHREDGPAIEWFNGYKEWYFEGLLHRIDGPAIEWKNGDKYWFINGVQFTEEEFNDFIINKIILKNQEINIQRMTYLSKSNRNILRGVKPILK